jgi:hypothetical protein
MSLLPFRSQPRNGLSRSSAFGEEVATGVTTNQAILASGVLPLRGHLSACLVLSGHAERMSRYAKGIELPEAVLAGVSA